MATMKTLISIANILLLVVYPDGESLRKSSDDGIVSKSALDNKRMEHKGNPLSVNQAHALDQSSTKNNFRLQPNIEK